MELILNEDDVKEILIEDIVKSNPNDKAEIHIRKDNSREGHPDRNDITKQIVAFDAIDLGAKKASEIHGIDISSTARYEKGEHIADEDTRSKILAKKYDIASTATAKLMDTLGLFDPTGIEKQTDIIKAASMLSNIVEKITAAGNKGNTIELHLYAPKQNDIRKYEVIDV